MIHASHWKASETYTFHQMFILTMNPNLHLSINIYILGHCFLWEYQNCMFPARRNFPAKLAKLYLGINIYISGHCFLCEYQNCMFPAPRNFPAKLANLYLSINIHIFGNSFYVNIKTVPSSEEFSCKVWRQDSVSQGSPDSFPMGFFSSCSNTQQGSSINH